MSNTVWIKCNLPWHFRNYENAPILNYPNLDNEIRQLFGKTEKEMELEVYGEHNFIIDSPVWKEFQKFGDPIQEEVKVLNLPFDEARDERYRRLSQIDNPIVQSVLACRKHSLAIQDWHWDHPDIKTIRETYNAQHQAWDAEVKKKSFVGLGLAKSGTLMHVMVLDKIETHLIGTVNESGGACDDCMGFPSDSIILEYKVVYSEE